MWTETVGLYVTWRLAHWAVTNVYTTVCAPPSAWGAVQAVLLATPGHCAALRSFLTTTGAVGDELAPLLIAGTLARLRQPRR